MFLEQRAASDPPLDRRTSVWVPRARSRRNVVLTDDSAEEVAALD